MTIGELVGVKGYSGGQEKDWMGCLEDYLKHFGIKVKGLLGARQHRRPADGSDGARTGPRPSCGNGMTRRGIERQYDTRRLQPRREPLTPTRTRAGGVVLPMRLKSVSGHHCHDVCFRKQLRIVGPPGLPRFSIRLPYCLLSVFSVCYSLFVFLRDGLTIFFSLAYAYGT